MNEAPLFRTIALLLAATSGALAQAPKAAPATAPAAPLAEAGTKGRALDLQTVIQRTLANNPTLRGAELDAAQARQTVLAEEGRYPYVFQADAAYTRSLNARLSPDDSINSFATRSYSVGTALRRTFPMGTTAELRVQGERIEADARDIAGVGSSRGYYGATARASLTQPLLRNAGRRVGEVELRAARESRALSDKARRRIKSDLVRDATLAYWELWYAAAALEIENAALRLAERQENEARQQVGAGALAPADVLTFSTRVAQLEESVVLADIQRRQRSLELARLMSGPDAGTETLAAKSDPLAAAAPPSRAQVEAALRSGSVELAELEAQVRVARTRAEVAGEANRPALDLEGSIETTGLSERVPRAIDRASQLNWTTARVGLVFELPLSDARKNAERASALLAVRIAEQNVKAARDRIAAEAALATANDTAARRRMELAERTLDVASKTYEAERARFELGESIPMQVQEAEEDVRRARLSVARARVDLAQTQTDISHLTGELSARYETAPARERTR
jgi:outer membrane protein TolC